MSRAGEGADGRSTGPDGSGRAGSEATPERDLRERVAVPHRHPPGTTGLVVVLAALLAWYASWLTADVGLGTVAFVLVAVVAAYGLYRQPTRRGVLVAGLAALAVLLVATPLFLNLPFALAAGAYGIEDAAAFTLTQADLVFVVAFVVLAAVPGGIAWWLSRR